MLAGASRKWSGKSLIEGGTGGGGERRRIIIPTILTKHIVMPV